jgi:membrane-anchored glycerophosphoryl diester phosphodiesterase (GDPDase)
MNLQAHLKNMLEMMQEEFVVLFIGGCLVQLLISLSLGILTGPLMAGYLLAMIRWLETGKKSDFNDLFAGMKRFGELFSVFFMMLLILLGYFLVIAPGILLTVWWLYVLPLMAHRGLTLGEAMKASKNKVSEKGFFMHLVFLLIISMVPVFVIYIAAAILPPLAVLQYFLFPLQCACLASLYLEQFTKFDPEKRGMASTTAQGFSAPAEPPPCPPPVPEQNSQGRTGCVGGNVQPAW